MVIKTKGIVLKAIKYGESSLIVDVFTLQLGLRKYIISGVRKKNAKFGAALFQHASLIDLVAYEKKGRNMHRIKEVQAAYLYNTMPYDIKKSAVGLFITEVVQKVLQGEEEHPELFDFLYDTYRFLDTTQTSIANIPITFLLNLTEFLGIQPDNNFGNDAAVFNMMEGRFQSEPDLEHPHFIRLPHSQLLSQMMRYDVFNSHNLSISASQRKTMLDYLLRFYQLHIDRFPIINSHAILEEVLRS